MSLALLMSTNFYGLDKATDKIIQNLFTKGYLPKINYIVELENAKYYLQIILPK